MSFWQAVFGPTIQTQIFGIMLVLWVLTFVVAGMALYFPRYAQEGAYLLCMVIRDLSMQVKEELERDKEGNKERNSKSPWRSSGNYLARCNRRIKHYNRMRIFHKLQATSPNSLKVALIIKGTEILESAERRSSAELDVVGDAVGTVTGRKFRECSGMIDGADFIFELRRFLAKEPWKTKPRAAQEKNPQAPKKKKPPASPNRKK